MALFGPRVGHEALFDEVCRYVDVDKKTKALLLLVIKKYQIAHPAKIFIEPETLMRAVSDPDFAAEIAELQKLYDDWFVEKAPGKRG